MLSASVRVFFRYLSCIKSAGFTVILDEQPHFFGDPTHPLQARMVIHDRACIPQILKGGSVAAGETYAEGLWSSPDLVSVIKVFCDHLDVLDAMESKMRYITWCRQRIAHWRKRNTVEQSEKNIHDHYDLGDDLYAVFLDEHKVYSSAIFDASLSLEDAQLNKIHRLAKKMGVKAGDHILEIGCGWGALAEIFARDYGCHVTGVTLSDEQLAYGQKRIEQAGLQDKVLLKKQDYRKVEGVFDHVVSVEMIEAVGMHYMKDFVQVCHNRLKRGGRLGLQMITIADQRMDVYKNSVDFIQKHIFPGGFLPSISMIANLFASETSMVIRDLRDIGLDYAKTLALWHDAFIKNDDKIPERFDDYFKRIWRFYFAYCEAAFRSETISAVQMIAIKR